MNKFGVPDYPEPAGVVGEHITRDFERKASRQMPGHKSNAIESVDIAGKRH
jgi:hypothetical protein